MDRKPILDEVVTVNLVSLPEVSGQPSENNSSKAKTKEPEPVVKPETAVKIPVEPKAAPKPVKKVKPVSLKPIKRKVRKTDPKKLAQEKAKRKRELEKKEALARAIQEEERAKRAAEDARSALAEMIRSKGAPSTSRGPSRGKQVTNVAEQIYFASIYDRVKSLWVLPEMRQWNPNLETTVVVTIRRDGTITRTFVEKKSGDPYFDQYAMKTLKKASPLPPIPKVLKKNSMEVGLVFRPGELSL